MIYYVCNNSNASEIFIVVENVFYCFCTTQNTLNSTFFSFSFYVVNFESYIEEADSPGDARINLEYSIRIEIKLNRMKTFNLEIIKNAKFQWH